MFAGFTDSHFDAYQPGKWKSNAFNLERMAVKEALTELGRELGGRLTAADGAPLACEVSVEHPALSNQKQVDSQQLYVTRAPDARQELDRTMDRSRSMAALLGASSPQRSHVFLTVSVWVDHLFTGLVLYRDADIDRRNLEAQLANPAQAQAFMALLGSLPPAIGIAGAGPSPAARPARQSPLEAVQQHLAAMSAPVPLGQTRWLTLGQRVQRADAVALGNAIHEPIVATLDALLPIYRFIAWTRENDHIGMRDQLDGRPVYPTEPDRAVASSAGRNEEIGVPLERRPVCLTERNRAVASSARRDEGAGGAPATEEQRSDAPQIRDFATEGKPVGALTTGAPPASAPEGREQRELANGDQVRITTGMFSGRTGVVQEIDSKGMLKVLVGNIQIKLEAREVEKR